MRVRLQSDSPGAPPRPARLFRDHCGTWWLKVSGEAPVSSGRRLGLLELAQATDGERAALRKAGFSYWEPAAELREAEEVEHAQ